jgi:peptidylprolyl isomerase
MRRSFVLLIVLVAAGGCSRGGESATTTPPTPPEIGPVDCGGPAPERTIPPVAPPAEIPTRLVVADLQTGTGPAAADGDTLYVDFTGIRSADGLVFDSSYTRGTPLDFPLGRGSVIAGWDQGLVGAQAGTLRRLDVPADLAYGDTPPGDVLQPGDALTFMIEVRGVVPASTAQDAPLDIELRPSTGATAVEADDIVVGDGAVLRLGDTAIVHALLVRGDNDVVLLNTWERRSPLTIDLDASSDAFPGLVQGLQCARVGGTRVVTLPPAWAFGPGGEPSLGLPREPI